MIFDLLKAMYGSWACPQFGGGSGGGNTTATTTTKAELPAYAQPQAIELLNRGSNLSNQPYQAYGGEQIAPLSAATQQGLQMQTQRAQAGNPAVTAGQNTLATYASPDFLDITKTPSYQTAMRDVAGRVGNQFSTRPGSYGGSANQEVLTRGLGDTANAMYSNQQAKQLQAIGMAPTLAQQDYQDINQMLSAGDVYGQRSQDVLNQQYQNWLAQQQWPYTQLDVLSNALAGSTGGRSTTTSAYPQPYTYSPAVGGLGGALAGGALGSMYGNANNGGNIGAAYAPYLAAGMGGLLGAFG